MKEIYRCFSDSTYLLMPYKQDNKCPVCNGPMQLVSITEHKVGIDG